MSGYRIMPGKGASVLGFFVALGMGAAGDRVGTGAAVDLEAERVRILRSRAAGP